MNHITHRQEDQAQRVSDRAEDEGFREERRADYRVLSAKLHECVESIKKLEKRFAETEEMWDSIRSLSKTFGLIERFCVGLVKIGAVVAGSYATYKFIIADLIRQVGGKG